MLELVKAPWKEVGMGMTQMKICDVEKLDVAQDGVD